MELKTGKREKDRTLIRSIILVAIGIVLIPIGISLLPMFGLAFLVGAVIAVCMLAAIYPWISVLGKKRINVLMSAVTDNNLETMRFSGAILSATKEHDGFDFDPRSVDPESVWFGPQKVRPIDDVSDPQVYERSLVDINNDGIPDLVLYFDGDSAGVTASDKEACIWARTRNRNLVFGCSQVKYDYESGLNELLEYK